MPLGELAQRIVAISDRAPLLMISLGSGDGIQETQLVAHLVEASAPSVELCLLDISQPLLSCAYRHASASCDEPLQLKARDRLFAGGVPAPYASWLGGPIWRHCKEVERVDFHWRLETRCPVPGSYRKRVDGTPEAGQ